MYSNIATKGERKMRLLDWFAHLPRVTQALLLISIMTLLIIVALDRTASGSLTSFLVVLLTMFGYSKHRKSE